MSRVSGGDAVDVVRARIGDPVAGLPGSDLIVVDGRGQRDAVISGFQAHGTCCVMDLPREVDEVSAASPRTAGDDDVSARPDPVGDRAEVFVEVDQKAAGIAGRCGA